ncbi:PAS domain S-box protein [Vandammella animalimorsus]|uniref:PAS domain S-box protein n=1 Tax=Vandammella animalimorsus TaxID=2029117 RepID=A0A3M6RIJ9_9BURK|nr:PAS domain-containing protein [Vandammella animalimorsus]RMX14913.1 PAS domain S-box protein [Vandammella animalimorsus]
MAFPPMQPADDAQQTHTLRFHDGSSRTVQVSQREIPYPDGRLIISRTDLQGIITHANEAFVELSGYTREELIGQPHCVLRHPDMPRAAFKDLWDTVAAGKKWHGYVKNLRKDGAHYWVYATAVPNVRNGQIVGYTSVRRKPSRKKIAEMSALYQQWLAAQGSAS